MPATRLSLCAALAALALAACSYVEPTAYDDATCTAPGQVHVLATDEEGATAIVLDGEHVYWSSRRGPRRAHVDGGVVVDLMLDHPDHGNPLGSGAPVGGLAVDGSYVWFGVWGALWRVPRGGGVAEIVRGGLDNSGSARQLLVDEEYVWWVDFTYDTLFRFEKRAPADGTYIAAFATTADEPVALALDGDEVWFGRSAIARDGFGQRVVDPSINPRGIELVGEHAFWTSETGSIVRFERDGPGREVFAIPGRPEDITSHDGRLYFALEGEGAGYGEMAVDGTGIAIHPLPDFAGSHAIAVSDEAVFLVTGAIRSDIVKVCR